MDTDKDLFGDPVVDVPRRTGVPSGHAAAPGTGPEGETCGSCGHLVRKGGGRRNYRKCGLMRAHWTNSYGSDVRAKDAACYYWEPRKEKP